MSLIIRTLIINVFIFNSLAFDANQLESITKNINEYLDQKRTNAIVTGQAYTQESPEVISTDEAKYVIDACFRQDIIEMRKVVVGDKEYWQRYLVFSNNDASDGENFELNCNHVLGTAILPLREVGDTPLDLVLEQNFSGDVKTCDMGIYDEYPGLEEEVSKFVQASSEFNDIRANIDCSKEEAKGLTWDGCGEGALLCFKGLFTGIAAGIKGFGEFLLLPVTLTKWLYSKVNNDDDASLRQTQEGENIEMAGDSYSEYLANMPDNEFDQVAEEPEAETEKTRENFLKFLGKQYMLSYACHKWAGIPGGSECLEPIPSWECATCSEKIGMFCAAGSDWFLAAAVGFFTAGASTALLTARIAKVAGTVSKAGKLKKTAKITQSLANGINKYVTFIPKLVVKHVPLVGSVVKLPGKIFNKLKGLGKKIDIYGNAEGKVIRNFAYAGVKGVGKVLYAPIKGADMIETWALKKSGVLDLGNIYRKNLMSGMTASQRAAAFPKISSLKTDPSLIDEAIANNEKLLEAHTQGRTASSNPEGIKESKLLQELYARPTTKKPVRNRNNKQAPKRANTELNRAYNVALDLDKKISRLDDKIARAINSDTADGNEILRLSNEKEALMYGHPFAHYDQAVKAKIFSEIVKSKGLPTDETSLNKLATSLRLFDGPAPSRTKQLYNALHDYPEATANLQRLKSNLKKPNRKAATRRADTKKFRDQFEEIARDTLGDSSYKLSDEAFNALKQGRADLLEKSNVPEEVFLLAAKTGMINKRDALPRLYEGIIASAHDSNRLADISILPGPDKAALDALDKVDPLIAGQKGRTSQSVANIIDSVGNRGNKSHIIKTIKDRHIELTTDPVYGDLYKGLSTPEESHLLSLIIDKVETLPSMRSSGGKVKKSIVKQKVEEKINVCPLY